MSLNAHRDNRARTDCTRLDVVAMQGDEARTTSHRRPIRMAGRIDGPRIRCGSLKGGQQTGGEQSPTRLRDQACPPVRAAHPRAVGRDPGVRVHLPIQLGDHHEGEPAADRRCAPRSLPDAPRAAELIPDGLGPRANLLGIERGVNAAKNHRRSPAPRQDTELVSAKGVPSVNADAHDVARLDGRSRRRDRAFHRWCVGIQTSGAWPPRGRTATAAWSRRCRMTGDSDLRDERA